MQITLAGSALSRPATDAQQEGVSLELAAFDGEVGNSTVVVPDPTGVDEVAPGLAVVVSEGTTVLLDGRIVSEGRERGSSPAAGQKQDTYQVDDPNTFMYGFRVVADRPEESDYARIQWFFDTYLPAADTTMVLNTSTSTMVAASYASDGVADIMRDAIDITGKTLFIHDKAAGGLCAHWHALTGGHSCGLTISDVFGDPNGTTVWYPQNPARVRDGADLANDILAYGADASVGPVNVLDVTSIATYDADGKLHQTFANFPNVTDTTTLAADAARLLETNKDPRDSFTCTIGPLDDAALALIRAGDIITVTSEILGLSASPQRISRLRLTVAAGNTAAPGLWDATLTMGAPVRGPGARFGRSVAFPSTFPPRTPGVPYQCYPVGGQEITNTGHRQQNTSDSPFEWSSVAGTELWNYPGDFVIEQYWSIDGWATSFDLGGTFATDVDGVTPTVEPIIEIYAFEITSPPIGVSGTGLNLGGAVTVGSLLARVTLSPIGAEFAGIYDHMWNVGPITVHFGTPRQNLLFRIAENDFPTGMWELKFCAPTNIVGYLTDPSVPLAAPWSTETCANAPYLGQSVPLSFIATADGVEDTYTTPFSYAPGSLRVLVDRIDWTNEVTETDPAAGTFTFETPPLSGDDISAYFVGGY